MHAPVAEAFLKAGIHVICDKPLTTTLKEARRLKALAERSGLVFAVTHNYTGYPMVRQARAMVWAGALGAIRVVQVEYPQDWLSTKLEETGQKQAAWRTDPARSGAGGCIGDIGTHAMNLADYVTGETPAELCAELTTFVEGRRLDDNAQILLRYASGARGMLWASQVAPGNENALKLRVYGEKGGLEWRRSIRTSSSGRPWANRRASSRAARALSARKVRGSRAYPRAIRKAISRPSPHSMPRRLRRSAAPRAGAPPPPEVQFPTVADGVRGLAFIEAAVRSSKAGGRWTSLPAV